MSMIFSGSGDNKLIVLENKRASLTLDAFGGAIIDFHLADRKINPLSFRFTKEQMPPNNKEGAPYQGHFLCLGRWGPPSTGEIKAGMPDHGHFANIHWAHFGNGGEVVEMFARSRLEGLEIKRMIRLHNRLSMFMVEEAVTNINPIGRLYNMVQHPTLSAPYLDGDTRIECNATKGFHYNNYLQPDKYSSNWPYGVHQDRRITDLRRSDTGYSAVFSLIVDEDEELGWITAYSPQHHLLFGYVWARRDYPWINLWQDWNEDGIRYRGMEFGTTGVHQPFHKILAAGKISVFNNSTCCFIDAGATECRRYISFMDQVPADFGRMESVTILEGAVTLTNLTQRPSLKLGAKFIRFLISGE